MDRKAWFAVSLCIALLVAWFYYFQILHPPPPPRPHPPVAAASATPLSTPRETSPTAAVQPAEQLTAVVARSEALSGQNAQYIFSNDKGGIERAVLLQHIGEDNQAVFLNGDSAMPIGAVSTIAGQAWGGFEMHTDQARGEAVFTRQDPDGIETTKRFMVSPDGGPSSDLYIVHLDLEFHNTGAAPATRPDYFVSTGGASPIHSRDMSSFTRFDWMHDEHKLSTVDVNWFAGSSIPLVGIPLRAPSALFQETKPKTIWAAVSSQYFCTIVSVVGTEGNGAWASRFDTHRPNSSTPVYGIEGGIQMPGFTLSPGADLKQSFVIYAGPKDINRLRALGGGQDAVLHFGMFGLISEWLLRAMNALHNVLFGSYAAAIIVLTLIIKSCLWPLQNKATNQMRRMSLLSPKMAELKEKYQDDPQKMNEEVMKMYREYGVNPLSGCLPMLIQIPIFFGFYAMLGSAIELRNSHFLWVTDLSQPDTLTHVLGFPINVLPIVMAGTMIWQMTITPKSGDAMQQRMFYFMPVIFLVFCYNYAAGLALYWTTQNLFSIVQLYLTRNRPLPTLEKKSVIAKREAGVSKKKKKRPGL